MPYGLSSQQKFCSAKAVSKKEEDTSKLNKTLKKKQARKRSHSFWTSTKRGGYRRADSCSSSEEDTASYDEYAHSGEEDFFQRFNLTVMKTAARQKLQDTTARRETVLKRPVEQKSVRFHKYDHVMFVGGDTEYVYSLYDREVEEEAQRNRIAENIEDMVTDVSHFFKFIKKGIQGASRGELLTDGGELIIGEEDSVASDSFSIAESVSTASV